MPGIQIKTNSIFMHFPGSELVFFGTKKPVELLGHDMSDACDIGRQTPTGPMLHGFILVERTSNIALPVRRRQNVNVGISPK